MSTWGRPKILEDARYLSIKVPLSMYNDLKELSAKEGVSVSELVRRAIVKHTEGSKT